MPTSHPRAETIETEGCRIVLCRVDGPEARELFFACQPPAGAAGAGAQAEAIQRAIAGVLEAEGASFRAVVSETLFLRAPSRDLEAIRAARSRVIDTGAAPPHRPATTVIEQPPIGQQAHLEVSGQALLATGAPLHVEPIGAEQACTCTECARAHGLKVQLGGETRLYAGGLCGPGPDAHAQTLAMFAAAEDLLRKAGLELRDVVRTWIHLRDIDRDYGAFNAARRAFFESRGVDPAPASTGIGGGPASPVHELCLGLYAVRGPGQAVRTVMSAPTLNEAPQYGADFVRGMKVVEANKTALHVSGTASIDEAGRTAHPGELDAQADRMLVNIAALLEGQGAGFGDVVSAVTYVKRPSDAERLRAKFRDAGFEGFPNVWVAAPICRPDLLCETEALAVLPRAEPSKTASAPKR